MSGTHDERKRDRAPPCFRSSHPRVQLDAGAVLRDKRAAVREVSDVGHAADAAGVVRGPVVEAPLVLVLQGRQLDRLDVQTGIHQLSDSKTHKSIGGFKLTGKKGKKVRLNYETFGFKNALLAPFSCSVLI